MINIAVFRKTLIDSGWTLAMGAIGLVAFVILFVWGMLNMGTEILEFVSRFPFIKKILEISLGIDVSGEISVNILFAVCFTHAVVLSLAWGVIIATTTRVTVGEVERGTADLLLSLPVTRPEVYMSTTLVWILSAGILSFCPVLGIAIAAQIFETKETVQISKFVSPATNFFFLNLAVGGVSSMIGTLLNRRGQAVGIIVGIILVSVVLNFLEPFLEFIKTIRFLSLLNYFRPVDVVRTGQWPVNQMLVLLGLAGVSWVIGLVVFSRKDIPTA